MVVKNYKYYIIIFVLIISIMSIYPTYAQETELKSDKPIYNTNDTIQIYLNISDITKQTNLIVISDLKHLENKFSDFEKSFRISLLPHVTTKLLLYEYKVNEYLPNGKYRVRVSIQEEFGDFQTVKILYFNVNKTDILPDLPVSLKLCKDKDCLKETKIFTKGETIYLAVSSLTETRFKVNLILPNRKIREIEINKPIQVTEKGNYLLEIKAYKKGYKESIVREIFSVIEKTPELKTEIICKINGKCERARGETKQNCPLDCKKGKFKYNILLASLIISLIIITFILIRKLKKHKE